MALFPGSFVEGKLRRGVYFAGIKEEKKTPTIKGIYIIIKTRLKFVLLLYVCMYFTLICYRLT